MASTSEPSSTDKRDDAPSSRSGRKRGGKGKKTGNRKGSGKGGVRHERSAGVVCFRERDDGERVYLLLDYGRHWGYPKGHLEKGEDDVTAARRELREETGIKEVDIVDGFTFEIVYHFHSGTKGPIRKVVAFFAGRVHRDEVYLSEEHVGYAWATYEQAMDRLTFDNARNVLNAAVAHLDEAGHVSGADAGANATNVTDDG